VLTGFRENVKRHDMEHRELKPDEESENVVLQFNPRDHRDMLVPCLWDRWEQGGIVLNSFAVITDDPPSEVAAAGHNRCPINLTKEAAEKWLAPQGRTPAELLELADWRRSGRDSERRCRPFPADRGCQLPGDLARGALGKHEDKFVEPFPPVGSPRGGSISQTEQ
jgi:hypothetical protein